MHTVGSLGALQSGFPKLPFAQYLHVVCTLFACYGAMLMSHGSHRSLPLLREITNGRAQMEGQELTQFRRRLLETGWALALQVADASSISNLTYSPKHQERSLSTEPGVASTPGCGPNTHY